MLQSNNYEACFLGVTEEQNRLRGGLINTHNILGLHLQEDVFKDIGGFTSEELELVYQHIFREDMQESAKVKYGVSASGNAEFIATSVGSGLFNIRGAMSVNMKSCHFTNIWNVDKKDSF